MACGRSRGMPPDLARLCWFILRAWFGERELNDLPLCGSQDRIHLAVDRAADADIDRDIPIPNLTKQRPSPRRPATAVPPALVSPSGFEDRGRHQTIT